MRQKDTENENENDSLNKVIHINPIQDFFTKDYLHYDKHATTFDGRPEFALHNKQNFELREESKKPEVYFSSI